MSPCHPDAAACAIGATYRAWARVHGLVASEGAGLRICGALGGSGVIVDPGIDRGVAHWVEVTVEATRPETPGLLVTRATAAGHPAAAALRRLFDGPFLGPELRAITIAPSYVRVSLAPGAPPEAVEAAVAALHEMDSMPQPSRTTLPWP